MEKIFFGVCYRACEPPQNKTPIVLWSSDTPTLKCVIKKLEIMKKIFETVQFDEWLKVTITTIKDGKVSNIEKEFFPIDGPTAKELMKGNK